MKLQPGQQLLRGRYRLLDAPLVTDKVSVSWPGVGPYDTQYLIKAWPFEGDTPDEYKRALWDAELRTLYRVASTPGAEETILVIRDAGLDRQAQCFVMILEADNAGGYELLSTALNNRQAFPWLQTTSASRREELWQNLTKIAEGITLLHDQTILHRNIEADCVFFNRGVGVQSLRLGGFEWSL